MYFPPQPLSALTLVSAAVSVVFPWSTCPMVPTFTWGLVRSNFAFAMAPLPVKCRVATEGRKDGTSSVVVSFPSTFRLSVLPSSSSGRRDSNPRPSAWKADALPTELHPRASPHGGGRIRTFVGRSPADLQSAAINHSATPPTNPLHTPADTEPRRASGVSGAGSAELRHWS